MTFDEQHSVYLARCEQSLSDAVKEYFTAGTQIAQSAEYSLLNGGKRVRGVLLLAVCDMLGANERTASIFSAAIEMVHSFSLIHDDLPCMDDDDMRRGKPANHIAFGEATALLAGDALLTAAFEAISNAPASPETLVQAVRVLSRASGDRGMIYGQELDLKYEDTSADHEALLSIHKAKTGALIRASIDLGVIAADKTTTNLAAITKYADNIGLSFQIVDDILDVTSSDQVLGKPVGSDSKQQKTTFVTLFGVDKSKEEVQRLTNEAVLGLEESYGDKAAFLCEFARRLSERLS